MIVLQVIPSYPPATAYTGPPEQVHRLCRELRALGVDVRVVTTNANGTDVLDVPANRWVEHEGVPVLYGGRVPGSQDVSWGAWRELRRAIPIAGVVHVTGIFGWVDLAVDAIAGRAGVPTVISPRGSLDPAALAFSRGKKAVFLRLGGRRALRRAAAFHVTSEMEARHVRACVPGAATFVVPNGVAIPADENLERWRAGASVEPVVLYLGRLHPKKNLTTLVQACQRVHRDYPRTRFVLAGPDEGGYRAEIESLTRSLGVSTVVDLPGRVGGEVKHRLLASARCLVLPSLTENFGNVVAEALAHGSPVVASTGTPWAALTDHGCGAWVEPTAEALARALGRLVAMSTEEARAMGDRGRRWMEAEFAWPALARRMADTYASLIRSGRSPRTEGRGAC